MTILGKHTVQEARDLLAVADYRFKETFKAFNELQNKPQDLIDDGSALAKKWQVARKEVSDSLINKLVYRFPIPADYIPAEDEYNTILSYIQFGELTKGSLQDITIRIEKLRGSKILYEKQPRSNSTDVDQIVFQNLDATIRENEAAADELAKKAGKKAENSKWPWIIGGAIVGTYLTKSAIESYIDKKVK